MGHWTLTGVEPKDYDDDDDARVTCLYHRWGAPEAEIFFFKFLLWPGFEPRTSQSNGRERNLSITATPPHICGNVRVPGRAG